MRLHSQSYVIFRDWFGPEKLGEACDLVPVFPNSIPALCFTSATSRRRLFKGQKKRETLRSQLVLNMVKNYRGRRVPMQELSKPRILMTYVHLI